MKKLIGTFWWMLAMYASAFFGTSFIAAVILYVSGVAPGLPFANILFVACGLAAYLTLGLGGCFTARTMLLPEHERDAGIALAEQLGIHGNPLGWIYLLVRHARN